jgi:TldD protein
MIISKPMAISVLNEALKSGADFAEIYVQNKTSHILNLSHKRVDTNTSSLTFGAGIRLIKDLNVVYGYTSDLSKKSLMKLASDLAASFQGKQTVVVSALKTVHNSYQNKPEKEHSSMSDDEKITYLKKAETEMYSYSPLIINAFVSLMETDEDVEIYNSKCKAVYDTRVRTRLIFNATAGKDGQFENGGERPGASVGLELLDRYNPAEMGKDAAKTAVDLLFAPECPSGKMTVIIGNAFGGVLFHESCGHPLEGIAISHKTSVFTGKLGQKIASDIVSAEDDGTIVHGWGSSEFDDEGEKTTKNQLIKDGVLVSYMMDDFNGKRMNRPSTGACRRESYKFVPTTRMTNTFIDNGKSTVDEIIAATESGLYCVSFNGGSVDPSTDKFNFTASKAYIIKNGKIDHLVRDASLIGYGYEVLMNIDMVANDLARGEGMCGASSGSIPADVGQPTIRVKNVTVGGRGEQL